MNRIVDREQRSRRVDLPERRSNALVGICHVLLSGEESRGRGGQGIPK